MPGGRNGSLHQLRNAISSNASAPEKWRATAIRAASSRTLTGAAPQIRQIYYGALPPPDITLTLNRVGNQFQLIWGRGFLQSADNVTGPYVDVPGAPLSPYTINPSGISKFFRARE